MIFPNHIAIIMDGNGRWGIKHYNNRKIGHKFGIKNLEVIIKHCLKIKIKNLTIFALSRDNLKRSASEISNIFNLFKINFKKNEKFFLKNKINLKIIGEKKKLPYDIINIIKKINKKNFYSKKKNQLNLNIAFNYSSKEELINSIKKLIKKRKKVNNENISRQLYTFRSGDPEILIRTGGRNRLSDFLLWQISYSEIFFIDKLWPDFKNLDLDRIIKKFTTIKRNYGS